MPLQDIEKIFIKFTEHNIANKLNFLKLVKFSRERQVICRVKSLFFPHILKTNSCGYTKQFSFSSSFIFSSFPVKFNDMTTSDVNLLSINARQIRASGFNFPPNSCTQKALGPLLCTVEIGWSVGQSVVVLISIVLRERYQVF